MVVTSVASLAESGSRPHLARPRGDSIFDPSCSMLAFGISLDLQSPQSGRGSILSELLILNVKDKSNPFFPQPSTPIFN